MSVNDFDTLVTHVGHAVTCVTYGDPAVNVAIECEDCNEILLDFDRSPHDDVARELTLTSPFRFGELTLTEAEVTKYGAWFRELAARMPTLDELWGPVDLKKLEEGEA
jgi:hypothetical protein